MTIEERVELQGRWLGELIGLGSLIIPRDLDRNISPLPSMDWLYALPKTLKHLKVNLFYSDGLYMREPKDCRASLGYTTVHLDELFPSLENLDCGCYRTALKRELYDAEAWLGIDSSSESYYKKPKRETAVPSSVYGDWFAHIPKSVRHLSISPPVERVREIRALGLSGGFAQ